MRFKFSRSSRRHKIGRAHALAALAAAGEPTLESRERDGVEREFLHWIGTDDRGVELEIIGTVAVENPDLIIIIHVLPTTFHDEKGPDHEQTPRPGTVPVPARH